MKECKEQFLTQKLAPLFIKLGLLIDGQDLFTGYDIVI